MRRLFILCAGILLFAAALTASAATGRVYKVLPLFLDEQGRESLSPSLYERDSYQAILRRYPARRSGIRIAVDYKARGRFSQPPKIRVELLGVTQGGLPKQHSLESSVEPTSWFGRWTYLPLTGEAYKEFGEIVAWRVTLWEGDKLLGEQKSFLWQ